jgi:hypothetical protein
VTIAMLVLAVLGVVTVFHQPLGALISPPAPAATGETGSPR